MKFKNMPIQIKSDPNQTADDSFIYCIDDEKNGGGSDEEKKLKQTISFLIKKKTGTGCIFNRKPIEQLI